MDDDLVDHHLREQWRGKRHELDRKGGNQHIAKDAAVLEQFRHEPAEAEPLTLPGGRVGIADFPVPRRGAKHVTRVARLELRQGKNPMSGLAFLQECDASFLDAQHQGKA